MTSAGTKKSSRSVCSNLWPNYLMPNSTFQASHFVSSPMGRPPLSLTKAWQSGGSGIQSRLLRMQSKMIRLTGSRSLLCNAHHLYNLLDLFESHIPRAAEVRTKKSPESTGEWLENPSESAPLSHESNRRRCRWHDQCPSARLVAKDSFLR
jgi:hypothetical protein